MKTGFYKKFQLFQPHEKSAGRIILLKSTILKKYLIFLSELLKKKNLSA